MESELNRKIREILELFGIDPMKKVDGAKWALIGCLKDLIESELLLQHEKDCREFEELLSKVLFEQKRRGKLQEKWTEGWNACVLVIKEALKKMKGEA
jgi:hypothetical protein